MTAMKVYFLGGLLLLAVAVVRMDDRAAFAGLLALALGLLQVYVALPLRVKVTLAAAYLTTGIVGFLASAWWYHPAALSVGSSGSLFGLIGILISYISQGSGFASQYRTSLTRWAIYVFIMGFFLGADNAAHLGGLVSGLALGRLVSDRRPATAAQRFAVRLMGWGSAAVILTSLTMTMLHLRPAS